MSGNVGETYRSLAKRVSAQTDVPYVLIDGGLKTILSYAKLGLY